MFIVITLSVLLILLLAHLFVLPLSKRRPIFIKGFEGSFFLFICIAVIAAIIHPLLYVLAIAVGLYIYYTKSWIVYGVSVENISNALDKAVLATRATSVKVNNGCEVDNSMLIRFNNLGMRVCYIRYKSKTYSKKSELTKEIFRKFILNYFI